MKHEQVKDFRFELVNEAFANLKLKRIFALEDLEQTDTESEFIANVEKLEMNGSGWSCNRTA